LIAAEHLVEGDIRGWVATGLDAQTMEALLFHHDVYIPLKVQTEHGFA
jgi:hypothetical protein